MQFLYKQGGTTYEQLQAATREAESEFSKGSVALIKTKAATASAGTSKDPIISDINERIDMVAVILKSASLNQNNGKSRNWNLGTPKKKNSGVPQNRENNSPNKFKGPETSAVGPFMPGEKPNQCKNCSR